MGFEGGEKKTELQAMGPVAKHNTGTTVRFWPDPRYFDTPQIAIPVETRAPGQGGPVPRSLDAPL